jgi:hypothetical protein
MAFAIQHPQIGSFIIMFMYEKASGLQIAHIIAWIIFIWDFIKYSAIRILMCIKWIYRLALGHIGSLMLAA